jgi:hypothetical protein
VLISCQICLFVVHDGAHGGMSANITSLEIYFSLFIHGGCTSIFLLSLLFDKPSYMLSFTQIYASIFVSI